MGIKRAQLGKRMWPRSDFKGNHEGVCAQLFLRSGRDQGSEEVVCWPTRRKLGVSTYEQK